MYENWLKGNIPRKILIIILIIAIAGSIYIELNRQKIKNDYYEDQVEAARLMYLALEEIRNERLAKEIVIDKQLDSNQTGIIGKELTPITTSLGNLESKRTATNPDFAALLVHYFYDLGLEEGELVAVGASGSFPSLILATLAAAETVGLNTSVIYSVGSSMYGANIPQFTFLDMLSALNEAQLLESDILAVSPGGTNDRAEDLFFSEDREVFIQLLAEAEQLVIYEDSLVKSIEKRLELYRSSGGGAISCFVNIGGASANFGKNNHSLKFPAGLVKDPPPVPADPDRGLIYEYAARGIPVINLLNIRGLAQTEGLAVDPVPLPEPGASDVYYQVQYNRVIIIILLGIICLIIIGALKINVNSRDN